MHCMLLVWRPFLWVCVYCLLKDVSDVIQQIKFCKFHFIFVAMALAVKGRLFKEGPVYAKRWWWRISGDPKPQHNPSLYSTIPLVWSFRTLGVMSADIVMSLSEVTVGKMSPSPHAHMQGLTCHWCSGGVLIYSNAVVLYFVVLLWSTCNVLYLSN